MSYGLPDHGEQNWDTELNASIEAVKATADGAASAVASEAGARAAADADLQDQIDGLGGGGATDPATLPRIMVSNSLFPEDEPIEIGEGTSGHSDAFDWNVETGSSLGVGTDFLVADPGVPDSSIEIRTPGVYAISWSISANDTVGARTTSSLKLTISAGFLLSGYDAALRGGMPDGSQPTGSLTFYVSQDDIDNDRSTVAFDLYWTDYDVADMGGYYADAMIQKIA